MYTSIDEIVEDAVEKAFSWSGKKYGIPAEKSDDSEDLKEFLRWWYGQRPEYMQALEKHWDSGTMGSTGFPRNVAADAMFVYAMLSGKVPSDSQIDNVKKRLYDRITEKFIPKSVRFTFEELVAEVAKYDKVKPDSTKILTPYDVRDFNRPESEIVQLGIEHVAKLSAEKYGIPLNNQARTGITDFMNWFFEQEPHYKSLFISSFKGVIFPNSRWPINFFRDSVLLYAVLSGRAAIPVKEQDEGVAKTIDSLADLKYLRPVNLDKNTRGIYFNCGHVYPNKARISNVPIFYYQKLVELIGFYPEIEERLGGQIVYEEDVGRVNRSRSPLIAKSKTVYETNVGRSYGDRNRTTAKSNIAGPAGEIGPANDVASLLMAGWSQRFDPGYDLVMHLSSDRYIALKLEEQIRPQWLRQIGADIRTAIGNTLNGLGLNGRISSSIKITSSGIVRLSYDPHGKGNLADTMSFLQAYAEKIAQHS